MKGVKINDVNNVLYHKHIRGYEKIPVSSGQDIPQVVTTGELRNYIKEDIEGSGENNVIEKITFNGQEATVNEATKTAEITYTPPSEKDPTVPSHVKSITLQDINNWNSKQDNITDLDEIRNNALLGKDAYQKPSTGIPKSDLSQEVQNLLDNPSITAETDPIYSQSPAAIITYEDIGHWNSKSDFTGNYNDLYNKPTIPSAQIQSDWNQTNTNAKDYIKNKPTIPQGVTVDDALNGTSENPVQNKVINNALNGKQSTIADLNDIRSGANAGATAYQKPANGIPKSDLTSDVQTSLGKADTALQSYTESDPTVPSHVKAITTTDISNWNGKQNAITFDSTPTASSSNPVTSGGVKTALDLKANQSTTYSKTEVDVLLSNTEETISNEESRALLAESTLRNNINDEVSRAQLAEENLRQLYNNLQQSQPIPVTSLPSSGEEGKIYRLAGSTSYADYMWNGTQFIKMAEYDNAIDNVPTENSNNLVKSGGVYDAIENNSVIITEKQYNEMSTFDDSKIYFVYVAEKYNITNELTNVTTNNHDTVIDELTSYTATLSTESNYKLTSVTVMMGGINITNEVYNNKVINIPSVTNNIVITASATALQQYTITNNLSHASNSNVNTTIYEESSYSGTLNADMGYYISQVTITMGGVDITSSAYSENEISIASVTGNIVITAQTTQVPVYTINNTLTNVTNSNSATYANQGSVYSATLSANTGYTISSVSIMMNGVDVTNSVYSNGNINISSVSGNIEIIATASAPNITINDNVAKSILVEHFDTNNDGEINTIEAAAVTSFGTYFKNNTTITDISWLQYFSGLTTMASAFYGCTGVTSLDITSSAPVSSFNDAFRGMTGITGTIRYANAVAQPSKMASMFYGCNKATYIDLTGVNTVKTDSISSCFLGCTLLATLNISGWNLSLIKNRLDGGFAPTNLIGSTFTTCNSLTSIIMDGCNSDTLSVIEQALVLSSAKIAQNVTISVDGVNHTYDGTNWN